MIWDETYLKVTRKVVIKDVFARTELETNWRVHILCEMDLQVQEESQNVSEKMRMVRAALYDGEELIASNEVAFVKSEEQSKAELDLKIEKPKLWQVNGVGEQSLYRLVVEAWDQGQCSDRWERNIGFRSLKWERNEGAPQDALPYTPVVNGRKVYIKGVNITPLDVMYGSVSKERYERLVMQMKNANINLVRIWGGGVIEKEYFYDLCDKAGILVWQEFIQSGSGLDSVPSKDTHFLELLKAPTISALKSRRNHVSLACWCGGNELADFNDIPATYEDENISMLKALVEEYDPGRYFLPCSASGPSNMLREGILGVNHDVHGPWLYGGVEGHYRLLNESDSMLHSEFGVSGFTALSSMRKFLPEELLRITLFKESEVLRHHGEVWDTLDRDLELFGTLDDLETLIKASQWVQAEGLRYAVESNRRREFQNSGSIIWQFNEPFPNASCTSLVDYYGCPKMAYYYVKNAYAPLHGSLKYNKLVYAIGETFETELFIHNCLESMEVEWELECFDLKGKGLWKEKGRKTIASNCTERVAEFSMKIEQGMTELFAVRILIYPYSASEVLATVKGPEGVSCLAQNTYLFSTIQTSPFRALMMTEKPLLEWFLIKEEFSSNGSSCWAEFKVTNTGDSAAWYIRSVSKDSGEALYSPQNFSVLLPSESMIFEVDVEKSASNFMINVEFTV